MLNSREASEKLLEQLQLENPGADHVERIREEKVRAIRTRIKSGAYKIDSKDVAKSLFFSH